MSKIIIDENIRFTFKTNANFSVAHVKDLLDSCLGGHYPWILVKDLNGKDEYINLNNVKTIKVVE